MRLRDAAVGIALGEAVNDAHEIGGNNRGPYVRKYLKSVGFDEGAAWCAAFTWWCIIEGARFLGVSGFPLAELRRRALVAAYIDFAREHELVVLPGLARPGDLVAFQWPSGNHIGFVLERPPALAGSPHTVARFATIEGNTSPGVGLESWERERDGDGVYRRRRKYDEDRVTFIRWDGGLHGPKFA